MAAKIWRLITPASRVAGEGGGSRKVGNNRLAAAALLRCLAARCWRSIVGYNAAAMWLPARKYWQPWQRRLANQPKAFISRISRWPA